MEPVLRLGTRGSFLARTQSQGVADELMRRHPGLRVELRIIKTSGDKITDQPLHAFGGKGLFTKELEQALLAGEVDFAVHSFKDVPVTMPLLDADQQAELIIAAVPAREDPRDVIAMRDPALLGTQGAAAIKSLPAGMRIGTGSLRRRCQILSLRPELHVEPIRGNIDTRLRKCRDGTYDVVVLAMAGLRRSGLFDASWMGPIEPAEMLPAAGQGALALQCRRDDAKTMGMLQVMHDPATATCVELERGIVQELRGDCHSPIAALATLSADGARVELKAVVGARDGEPPILTAHAIADRAAKSNVLSRVMAQLRTGGVEKFLHG